MNSNKIDISFIENKLNLKSGELIVLGGRPAMGKTLFALNIVTNSSKNGYFISLCESSEEIACKVAKVSNGFSEKNYETICIERPLLIKLIELIIKQQTKFDYFVIDDMSGLDEDIDPLFSKSKNYQFVFRYLKQIAKLLNKNIILISQLDRGVEEELDVESASIPYLYYGLKEKFIDHILIIHRPAYYTIGSNSFYEIFEHNDDFLCVAKTKLQKNTKEIKIKFNYPMWNLHEANLIKEEMD